MKLSVQGVPASVASDVARLRARLLVESPGAPYMHVREEDSGGVAVIECVDEAAGKQTTRALEGFGRVTELVWSSRSFMARR